MRVEVVRGSELGMELVQAWANIQNENTNYASPFFSPQFTQVASEVRSDVFVGIIEDGGKPKGFFPYQRSKTGTGRPVGGALSDFHGPVVSREVEFDAHELVRRCSLTSWNFDYVPSTQHQFDRFKFETLPSPCMDLSAGFEAYAKSRRDAGSEQIKKVANLRRRIERELGTLRFVVHNATCDALNVLMGWKSNQYVESGTIDVFSHRWARGLLRRLLETRTAGFMGALSCLYVDDRLVAAHMGMRSRTNWHYWFPSYDREFARYSPGLMLLLAMAETAPSLGLNTIDLGKGEALYKNRLANGCTALMRGCVEVALWASTVRRFRTRLLAVAESRSLPQVATVPARLFRRIDRSRRFK